MNLDEKRKYQRVQTDNLVSYTCIDDNNVESDQGVGKAIDISQGGLLLESHSAIETEKILLTTVNEKNELMEIKASVAYCREKKPGVFHTGVQFQEESDKIRQIVVGMIKIYNLEKNT